MTKSGAIRTAFFESDIRPLQEVDGVNSKIKHHPFPSGIPLLLKIMQLFCKTTHRSQEGKAALA